MRAPPAHQKRIYEVVVFGLLPCVCFWLYSVLVELTDYGHGLERFAALAVGAGLTFVLPAWSVRNRRELLIVLLVVAGALLLFRTYQAARVVADDVPPSIDVGTTTIASVDLVLDGGNPYTAFIDPNGFGFNPEGTGFTYAGGFKYGPVMLWTFLPAVGLFAHQGYFFMNWLALIAAALAGYAWIERGAGTAAGVGAVALTLIPGFFGEEIFRSGMNDMVPAALCLGALACRERGMPVIAGVALGLSFATKLLPAVIVAIPLLMMSETGRRRFGIAAVLSAVAGYLPYLLTSFPELVASIVVFNLNRVIDDTSVLAWIPEWLRWPFVYLVLGCVLVVPGLYARKARSHGLSTFTALIATTIAVSFAASPGVHQNYLLWYLPFLASAVAAAIWSERKKEVTLTPTELV